MTFAVDIITIISVELMIRGDDYMQNNPAGIQRIVNNIRFKITIFVLVISSVLKLVIRGFGYKCWYFRPAEKEFSAGQTTLIYYGILVLFLVLYLVFVWEKKKWSHVLMISLAPSSVMMCLSSEHLSVVYYIAIVLFISLMALDVFLMVDFYDYADIRDAAVRKVIFGRQILSDMVINLGRSTFFSGVILIVVVTVVLPLQYRKASTEPVDAIAYATNVRDLKTTTPTDLWEPNKDKLRLLSMEVYKTLDLQERVNALQEVLNIECEYLGIEPCQLLTEDIEQESKAGYYSDHRGFISIDVARVEADYAYDAINIILHEAYHYYQAECMRNYEQIKDSGVNEELLFYRDCRSWADDLENYQACENAEDFDEYYQYASQSLETSANDYADEWIDAYWSFINKSDKEEVQVETEN